MSLLLAFRARVATPIVLAGLLVSVEASAAGGADESAAADVLFQDGKTLMAAKKAKEACPKFEASYKLDAKLGTLLNLADCFETIGRTGSAWRRFDEATSWAERENDDRAPYAKKRRDALASSLAKVRIDVLAKGADAKALTVFRDGIPLDEATVGAAVVVDPGPVDVSVRRGEQPIDQRVVEASPGREAALKLDLDAIAKAHPEVMVLPPSSKTQRTAGIVIGSVGLAGLATFGILEGVAFSKSSQANGQGGCKNGLCTPHGFATKRSAGDIAEAGQWVGIASAAVTAIGVTVFLTAPRAKAQKVTARVAISPYATPTRLGFLVGGEL